MSVFNAQELAASLGFDEVDFLAGNNYQHPDAWIAPDVVIGENNFFGPGVKIYNKVTIGDNNRFEGSCVIGSHAEHKEFKDAPPYGVLIGDDCWIREFVTINSGTISLTTLRNRVIMLAGSHIGHDATLQYDVTLACGVRIGGHSLVMTGANFGLNSSCHQRSVIGAYAMIGQQGAVIKSSVILPGYIYAGVPVQMKKMNYVGLQRAGISQDMLHALTEQFNQNRNLWASHG